MSAKVTRLNIPRKRVARILTRMKKKEILWSDGTSEIYKIQQGVYYKHKKSLYTLFRTSSSRFCKVHQFELSPDQTRIMFSVDRVGDNRFFLYVKPLLGKTIIIDEPTSGNFVWVDDTHVIFPALNDSNNIEKTYVYDLVEETKTLLYKNKDTFVRLYNLDGDILLYDSAYDSDEVYRLYPMTKLFPRRKDVYYPYIHKQDDLWYIHKVNRGTNSIQTTTDFKTFVELYKNDDPYCTLKHILIKNKKPYFVLYKAGEKTRVGGRRIDPIYDVTLDESLDIYTESYLTPRQKAPKDIPYVEKNVYIKPMLSFTIMYKKGRLPKPCKCVLYGYGAYGDVGIKYSPHWFELLDEGFIIVVAHIRGDGYFGFKGHEQGRMLHKKNSFKDFVEIIHYLFDHYTCKEMLTLWGRSAGGLLIAAVLNQYDLCQVAILGVPFVMPLLNVSCRNYPYGYESRREFGDIAYTSHYNYLKSYDPYYNLDLKHPYPHIFIYTNLFDGAVPMKEPLTYYEALKEADVFKRKEKTLTIFIDQKYGHIQGSSQTSKQISNAQIIEQIIKLNKMTPP